MGAAKAEPDVKEEKDEKKEEDVKDEKDEKKMKKEKKEEKKEHKDKKEAKEEPKKEKDKDKEKKDKKDKNGPATNAKPEETNLDLDQRKLFKEGQRAMTPPVSDPTRGFYESLLEENPESKIAIKFCIENGVFPLEKHKQLLKKYNHLKEKGAFSVTVQIKRALEKKKVIKD